ELNIPPSAVVTPAMTGPHFSPIKRVSICDTQPVTAEGVRTLLAGSADLRFADVADSLAQAADLARRTSPDVLMLDKAFGMQAILDWLADLRPAGMQPEELPRTAI